MRRRSPPTARSWRPRTWARTRPWTRHAPRRWSGSHGAQTRARPPCQCNPSRRRCTRARPCTTRPMRGPSARRWPGRCCAALWYATRGARRRCSRGKRTSSVTCSALASALAVARWWCGVVRCLAALLAYLMKDVMSSLATNAHTRSLTPDAIRYGVPPRGTRTSALNSLYFVDNLAC